MPSLGLGWLQATGTLSIDRHHTQSPLPSQTWEFRGPGKSVGASAPRGVSGAREASQVAKNPER